MYDRKKFIESIKGVLDLMPENVSPEGKEKLAKLKAEIAEIEEKIKQNEQSKSEGKNKQDNSEKNKNQEIRL